MLPVEPMEVEILELLEEQTEGKIGSIPVIVRTEGRMGLIPVMVRTNGRMGSIPNIVRIEDMMALIPIMGGAGMVTRSKVPIKEVGQEVEEAFKAILVAVDLIRASSGIMASSSTEDGAEYNRGEVEILCQIL